VHQLPKSLPNNSSYLLQWFGQFLFSSSSGGLVELSENSALRAATIGQAKSTGYFMKLRDWPEFDLIRPAGANRLIVGFKTVRTIVIAVAENINQSIAIHHIR